MLLLLCFRNKHHFNTHLEGNMTHAFVGKDIVLYNFTLTAEDKEPKYYEEFVLERGYLLVSFLKNFISIMTNEDV